MATIKPGKPVPVPSAPQDIDHFIKGDGVDTEREKLIGQHIGYRYDVNLLPDYSRLTPFLKAYIEHMGWSDLNWLEDVHMGYEEGRPAVFDRNVNGWVQVPAGLKLPDNQQDRDMLARELLIKFQMNEKHPLVDLTQRLREVLSRQWVSPACRVGMRHRHGDMPRHESDPTAPVIWHGDAIRLTRASRSLPIGGTRHRGKAGLRPSSLRRPMSSSSAPDTPGFPRR